MVLRSLSPIVLSSRLPTLPTWRAVFRAEVGLFALFGLNGLFGTHYFTYSLTHHLPLATNHLPPVWGFVQNSHDGVEVDKTP
jgi:hypothetical protein